ncbi:hypothetical protein [Winkia neuii]|nr:hypothetical protein [Winkia neuii]MDK8342384.1 hypothetical protein [Winkia sp. UMB3164B]
MRTKKPYSLEEVGQAATLITAQDRRCPQSVDSNPDGAGVGDLEAT